MNNIKEVKALIDLYDLIKWFLQRFLSFPGITDIP